MFRRKSTAHWIQKTHLLRADEYICSACGRRFDAPSEECPHCGRAMTGADYDPNWVDEAEFLDIFEK